jgi:hypothetical protein
MDLQEVITAALGTGCGAFISWLMDRIVEWREDDGQPVSPKTKRRVALALCAAVPSALIGILYLITWQYSWQAHVMAVGLAFVSNQMIHGERKLMTGEEVRAAERLERYMREPGPGVWTPNGEGGVR